HRRREGVPRRSRSGTESARHGVRRGRRRCARRSLGRTRCSRGASPPCAATDAAGTPGARTRASRGLQGAARTRPRRRDRTVTVGQTRLPLGARRPGYRRFMNRRADETSPYLRQHADNPVDWYPWGDEAFALARERDVPVFLSVGYSSCHWCHVMAHESFEDHATAAVMHQLFVNVKVDREERPDVDAIYMQSVQALTGRGGWPMSVWCTPDGRPFYGGTHYPDEDRHGMPGFVRVCEVVAQAWNEQRAD